MKFHSVACGTLASALLSFCSCQSLSHVRDAAPATAEVPVKTASPYSVPNRTVLAREYNPPAGPVNPIPASQTRSTAVTPVGLGHRHAGAPGAPCGPQCECCKPQQAFRFETEAPTGPFVPPGVGVPWPYDEYLWNGCDINDDVRVRGDYSVVGLDPQDTVIHYDTLDGRTKVKPANCVPIYAPRFAAVRKVIDPIGYELHERVAEANAPLHPTQQLDRGVPTTAIQPVQPIDQGGLKAPIALRDRNRGIEGKDLRLPYLAQDRFLPFEDLLIIRRGELIDSEKARLAESSQAAIVWTADQAVQVILDGKLPTEVRNPTAPQMTYVFEHEGLPCVRICKIASKSEANPGDIIDFTLRFDNVGDETVGNVTIIDNLISRLEYVEGSATCTLPAKFIPTPNDGESLTLRWELDNPLPAMKGGIIRFQCRLR